MHICLFLLNTHPNPDLNLIVGGIENQILQLLNIYEKKVNLKITIITRYSEYKTSTNKLDIHQISKFKNNTLDTLYFLIRSLIKIINIHKHHHISVINFHTYTKIVLIPILAKIITKIPLLMKIPLDFDSFIKQTELNKKKNLKYKLINYSWIKFFKQFLIKKIDFIRAINEKIYKELIDLGFEKKNILKIHNGINPKDFLDIKKKSSNFTRFGFIGRLTEFKNIEFLLNCFIRYLSSYPDDRLFFFGHGPQIKYLKNFIETNNLKNNIIFCGFEKNKEKIYSKIDVLIDPALAQGISNSNLEAMATETFLIASNVDGNRDLIQHKNTGLLFNPHKEKDLLKQLLYFKKNKNLSKKIISYAKKQVILNYDINIIADEIIGFLENKIGNLNPKLNKFKILKM